MRRKGGKPVAEWGGGAVTAPRRWTVGGGNALCCGVMESGLTVLVFVGLAATFAVLVVGVLAMLRGGEFNRKYGNKLMRARVIVQGLTILVLLVAFVVYSQT